MSGKLKVKAYMKPDGSWQFQVWAANNEALVTSQTYATKSDMMRAVYILTTYEIDKEMKFTETPDHENY